MGQRASRNLKRYASRVVAAGLVLAPALGSEAIAQQTSGQSHAALGPAQTLEVCNGDFLPPIAAKRKAEDQADQGAPPPVLDVTLPPVPANPLPVQRRPAQPWYADVSLLPAEGGPAVTPPAAAPSSTRTETYTAPVPQVLARPAAPAAPAAPAPPTVAEAACATCVPPANAPPPPAPEDQAERRPLFQRWMSWLKGCFLGYPENFHEPELGETMHRNFQTMVTNGDAARMVLYQYDFVAATNVLNHRGEAQLARMAAMLPHNFFPIVIEWAPELPGLAEARRLTVLNKLASGPFPVPPERVVTGPSLAPGLRGVEAILTERNLMTQTMRQGPPISSGGVAGAVGGSQGGSQGGSLGGVGGGGGGFGGVGGATGGPP